MATDGELLTVTEAFGRAATDTGWADPVETPAPSQPEEVREEVGQAAEQVIQDESEQSTEDQSSEEDSTFGDVAKDLGIGELAPEAGEPVGIDWDVAVELPGFEEPVPLSEMRDGFLRQADYTKKTQALANERKQFESEMGSAKKLFEALKSDPAGTAAYLAVQTGVIDESNLDSAKVEELRGVYAPPPSLEEIEARIEAEVEARLKSHPVVQQAELNQTLSRIENQFTNIETKYQVHLSDADKRLILKRALDANTQDLDLVFNGLQAHAQRLRSQRATTAPAAPARPGTRIEDEDRPRRVATVRDAFELAISELEGGG